MPSTYSTNLGIELIGTGEQSGTWGSTTNTNLGTLIEQAISGYATQAITDGADTVITLPNGSTGVARNMMLELTGTLSADRTLIVPAKRKLYFIYNNTSGGYSVTVKVATLIGVVVPNGKKMALLCNGTDIVDAVSHFNTVSATTANITTANATSAVIGSPTDGNKGSGSINAQSIYVNGVAVGTGSGSVSSVAVSGGTTGLTTSGGPITTSGTITLAGTLAAANGGTGQASYTTGDILYASGSTALSKLAGVATGNALISGGVGTAPSWGKVGLTTHISGTLAIANGGTGATTAANARTTLGAQESSANLTTVATPTGATALTIVGVAATDLVLVWDADASAYKKLAFQDMGTRVQAASTQTLALDDANSIFVNTTSSNYTITVPPNSSVAFPIGVELAFQCQSTGTITLAQGSGVTITSLSSYKKVKASGGGAYLIKTATDAWGLIGDLQA